MLTKLADINNYLIWTIIKKHAANSENPYKNNQYESNSHHAANAIADYGELLKEEQDDDNDMFNFMDTEMRSNQHSIAHHRKESKHSYFGSHYFDAEEMESDDDEEEENHDDRDKTNYNEPYSEKTQLTAFLLSFFLGWAGGGRFYVGDIIIGGIKFSLPLLTCLGICVTGCVDNMKDQHNDDDGIGSIADVIREYTPTVCVCGCGFCIQIIWWIVDWSLFAANVITDSDGKTLYPIFD